MMTEDQQKLVESNMNLVYKYVNKYGLSFGHDFDDSVQIASVGLCKAAIKYDESRGSFSTYAYMCMKREFLQIHRKNTIEKYNDIMSLDYTYDSEDSEYSLFDNIQDNTNIEQETICKDQIRNALNNLSNTHRKIIEYLISHPGCYQNECKKALGVSQPTVSRAIKQFRELYYGD